MAVHPIDFTLYLTVLTNTDIDLCKKAHFHLAHTFISRTAFVHILGHKFTNIFLLHCHLFAARF